VAELLFRAITVNKVDYTLAFGYQEGTTSLGYDTFKLTSFTGVVEANEYADLYDTAPIAAGKTRVDNTVYAWDTDLSYIGESWTGWASGSTRTVLYSAETGLNTVYENDGAYADISTSSKFQTVTGLTSNSDTENFINFGGNDTYKATDWKITYWVNVAALAADTTATALSARLAATTQDNIGAVDAAGNRECVIKANGEVTNLDISLIKWIFSNATSTAAGADTVGAVYVGTQIENDISDEIAYPDFEAKYINTDKNSVAVTVANTGDWLKVIDNDADGVAEYVLLTQTNVTDVQKVSGTTVTLSAKDYNIVPSVNAITSDTPVDLLGDFDLAKGDVVNYAVIDGHAYVTLADTVTAKIESVNRNAKTTTTTDGETYTESDSKGTAYMDTGADYNETVASLQGGVSYDLYFDYFGNLTVFTESAISSDFTLVLDGWYNNAKSGAEYAVKAYVDNAVTTVDTTTASSTKFIDNGGLNNAWNNLKALGGGTGALNYVGAGDTIRTTVASLVDGVLTPVDQATNKKAVRMITLDAVPKSTKLTGTAYYTTGAEAYDTYVDEDANGVADSVEVRALASTCTITSIAPPTLPATTPTPSRSMWATPAPPTWAMMSTRSRTSMPWLPRVTVSATWAIATCTPPTSWSLS
jgi:hypothetical protein